jgi:REP element-mobilizing transposase RayT
MSKSYCNLLYHIIFSTKERRPLLKGEPAQRVHAYLGGTIREEGGVPLIVGGVPDHIHILAKLRQNKSVSHIIGRIKSLSSGWIHRTFAQLDLFRWQEGYGAFTVSRSQVDTVADYIETQKQRHKDSTFEQEFIAFLDAHGIDYDPRYVFD